METKRKFLSKPMIITFIILGLMFCGAMIAREAVINSNILSDTYVIGSYGETRWNPRHMTISMHNNEANENWMFDYDQNVFNTVSTNNNYLELTPKNVADGVYSIKIGYNNDMLCCCTVLMKGGQIERVSTVATEKVTTINNKNKEVTC